MDLKERRRSRAEHRLARLIELRDHCCGGVTAEFGRRIKQDQTYALRMFMPIDRKERKGVGRDMEERINEAFNLPIGWFDMPLGTAIPAPLPLAVSESAAKPYNTELEDEESRLLRAYRLASPDLRRNLILQADGILEALNNPSQLTGKKSHSG